MTLLLKNTTELTLIAVIVTVLVVVAMSIDLVAGVMKAKERGEVCTSYGLHRTLYKFLTYTGSCICAYCIDYGNASIEAGKWWLGSAGEWIEIGAMRAGVLRAYEMLGMSFGGSQNSSTEYNRSNFWYAQAMLDWCQQISQWRPKTTAGPTTPITRLR